MSETAKTPTMPGAVEEAIATDDKATAKGDYGWLSWTVAIIFGLFYAYDLFEAISTTVVLTTNIASTNAALGTQAVSVPWGILIADLLVAPICYLGAFLIGRRQSVLAKALVFLLGLAVSASLNLSVEFGFFKLFN